MKRTVLISSTLLATIAVLELCQASKALPTPTTVTPTVNNQVAVLFNPNLSMRVCKDKKGGKYRCPGFVMPPESKE